LIVLEQFFTAAYQLIHVIIQASKRHSTNTYRTGYDAATSQNSLVLCVLTDSFRNLVRIVTIGFSKQYPKGVAADTAKEIS
jgi:hypothetical protein